MNQIPNQHLGPIAQLMAQFGARRGTRPLALDARLVAWRASLPDRLSTTALEEQAYEVLGEIVSRWHDRWSIDALFKSHLYQDKRTPRTYSLEVLAELGALHKHALFVVHRAPQSPWDELAPVRRSHASISHSAV
jgi:hypothetical protein